MSVSYLLLSSSHRDRLLYPNPSDFIIPFQTLHSTSLNLSVLNTVNPITQFPFYMFCWTHFQQPESPIFTTVITGGGGTRIFLDSNVPRDLLGLSRGSSVDNVYVSQTPLHGENILKNYRISIRDRQTTIVSYSVTYNAIEIAESIPFAIGDELQIQNKAPVEQNTVSPYLVVNGDFDTTRFFISDKNRVLVYNVNLNEQRNAIFLSNILSLQLESPFDGSLPTDKYLLFQKDAQLLHGTLLPFDNGDYYVSNGLLAFDILHRGQHYSHDDLVVLRTSLSTPSSSISDSESLYRIRGIDRNGGILHLELHRLGFQSFQTSLTYYVIPVPLILAGTALLLSSSIATLLVTQVGTVFRFSPHASFSTAAALHRPENYIGQYFQCLLLSPMFVVQGSSLFVSPNFTMPVLGEKTPLSLQQSQERNGVFGIRAARRLPNSPTDMLLHVESISEILLRRFDIIQSQYGKDLPSAFQGCFHSLIYSFFAEGVVPLNFTGTYLTNSQMSCYEVTVLNLILPNTSIDSLNSFLTSGFPYVLLEISNVTLPSAHNRNSLITNNPHATFSTFVCSISDVNDPLKTKFIKISSDGAIQIMKFSPADNLRFRILLPNGEPFVTALSDVLPPSLPNPLLQIECLFELKRL